MFYRINTQLYVQTVKLGVSILRLSLNDFYRYSIIRSFMTNVIDKINSVCLLSDDTIQALKESVTLCHFPKKHLLIKENTFCKFAYFIEKGMTRSFWLVNGEEITTSFSCEGGIVFSMDELYYNKLSEEFVETLEDVVAYKISLADLNRLFQTNILVWKSLFKSASDILYATTSSSVSTNSSLNLL